MSGTAKWRLFRYVDVDGSEPFTDWLNDCDLVVQRRIRVALARIEAGNLSTVKWIGGNLGECRMDTGPGYRVYLSRYGKDGLVLLLGGDKASQRGDIEIAKFYAAELKRK